LRGRQGARRDRVDVRGVVNQPQLFHEIASGSEIASDDVGVDEPLAEQAYSTSKTMMLGGQGGRTCPVETFIQC
jgi:hypothetical protein